MSLRTAACLALTALLAFSACGDDEVNVNNGGGTGATNNTANNGASNNTAATNNATTNNSGATNNNATTNNSGATNNTSSNNGGNECTLPEPTVGPHDSCAAGGLTSCFWNGDCPTDSRCQDVSGGNDVPCCVQACRGEGVVGDSCTTENDCETALCISRNDGPYFCTAPCDLETSCPTGYECHPGIGMCVPPSE